MRKLFTGLLVATLITMPAAASLKQGSTAPDFFVTVAKGGKEYRLHLKEQLRKGPVVVYFFPEAFTGGCTLEAKAFSDAMPDFAKARALVVGMSADDLPKLKKFSIEKCRSAFPVATASPEIIRGYDVAGGGGKTNRTSYVIDRDGRISFVHSAGDWSKHVEKTLAAVQSLNRKPKH